MKMLTKLIVSLGLALFLANASFAQQVKRGDDRAAAEAALAAKGWTQVESGGDISIIAIEINRDLQALNTYTVGTLVVDLFDAKTKNLAWRGVSGGVLSDKRDKNIKNLNRGVQKLFQHFPPDALKNS